MSIQFKRQDAYRPDDRAKLSFPEVMLIVGCFTACFFSILPVFFGLGGAGIEYLLTGLGFLFLALVLFALKVIIGALYDIREYQAKLNQRLSGEPSRERQEGAS